jgi:hypothetical protein
MKEKIYEARNIRHLLLEFSPLLWKEYEDRILNEDI